MGGISRYSAVVCLLAILIMAGIHHHEVVEFFTWGRTLDKLTHEIVIGVMSARENAVQRQAIRDTWAGYIQDKPGWRDKLLVKFIVGSKGCQVPPEFREDLFACDSIVATTPAADLKKEMVAFDLNVFPQSRFVTGNITSGTAGYFGIDFKFNYAAVIKRLGVYDTGSLGNRPMVVLYDTWEQEAVISVTFTPEDPGMLQDGYRYKDVESYLFPKNFEGTIVAGPFSRTAQGIKWEENQAQMGRSCKILSVRSFQRTAKTVVFPEEIGFPNFPIAAGNFIFELFKPEDVETMLNSRVTADREHAAKTDKESQALNDEQQQRRDLLLVNEVDVYRNIPKKLLRFFHWVINETEASLILKTDDDCFLNIEAIVATLQDGSIAANSRSWWGSFRTNWPLDALGKWAEHQYPSPVYPAFACGSGNLLSRDLVQWIGQNAEQLHSYQGEDVSVGIWLASILPAYIHDGRWQCDKVCNQDVFVLPELSPQELMSSWNNWLQCQNPCSCD